MNSLFGFDTSFPSMDEQDRFYVNDERAINISNNIDSEYEYDALNDETFGDPDKGDWENMNETLVRLEEKHYNVFGIGEEKLFEDDEIDLHLSRFEFGNGDVSLDEDFKNRLLLDSSIWDSPVKKQPKESLPQVSDTGRTMFQNSSEYAGNCFMGSFERNMSTHHAPIRMLSVEDVERNIIQHQQKERNKNIREQHQILPQNKKSKNVKKLLVPVSVNHHPVHPRLPSAPLLAERCPMFPPPPLLNHQSRIPVGFLPYNFLPSHYSTPINNLAMHPGFPTIINNQLGLRPRNPLPIKPNFVQNIQNNQFNNKLVQEIQQNHPLLTFNRQNYNKNCSRHHYQRYSNTSREPDYDEYSNLMSNREKQWLIGIQLTQLNSDTPYTSDYYFTVYKQRLAAMEDNIESQAYKDNQLNHPFTQQKTHASLAKNCSMLQILNRERKVSESKNNEQKDQLPRIYAPLQFKHSLGKLQCGSVTAPRKLIDMDVVGNELLNHKNTIMGCTKLRKSRHILLHIETLFEIVLKMEDLRNPVAIVTSLIMKEKRQKECMAQTSDIVNAEIETFDDLLIVLKGGLAHDKVTLMLRVRKGKMLLRRILVLLREHPFRWTLWSQVFSSIPFLLKKDRDDPEGILLALYIEFERHVQYSHFSELLKLAQTIGDQKIISFITSCKFLLSSVITIIFQMEVLLSKMSDKVNQNDVSKWIGCLELITGMTSKLTKHTSCSGSLQHLIKIDRENNILRTVQTHL